ncbi:Vacuolar protein sorting-associated protein 13 [Trypanosoma melophagium]|uniref:Vacuolar protein sorting-associated protein 13 n=2 Tax=Trypanosoma melophagium TaxID=715481 RepID=UPI00351A562B|nr:Vacuolar protein sorting-associated protein 13 [Trypanosoma melophagium]
MFITKYLASFISTCLQGLIKKVDADSLSVNILRNFIELKNVELDDNIVRYFRAYFSFDRGVIGRLRIKIPWMKLYSKQCEVSLEDVLLVFTKRSATPSGEDDDDDNEEDEMIRLKENIVELLEGFRAKPVIDASKDHYPVFGRLKRLMLRNTTISVKNCRLRYVQVGNNYNSATIIINKLTCASVSASGKPVFVTNDSNEYHRTINVEDISLTLASNVCTKSLDNFYSMKKIGDYKKNVNNQIEMELRSYGYTLKPFFIELHCVIHNDNSNLSIGNYGMIYCNKVHLSLSKIKTLLIITKEILSLRSEIDIYSKIRPKERPNSENKGISAAWWNYVINRVLLNISSSKRKGKFSWNLYQEWKLLCEEYYRYHLFSLGAPWTCKEDIDSPRVKKAIQSLSIGSLIQLRQQAKYTLEQFNLFGKIFPRYYGDTLYNKNMAYKVAAVEVLKGTVNSSYLPIDLSINIKFPELLVILEDKNIILKILFNVFSLILTYSSTTLHAISSISSARIYSGASIRDELTICHVIGISKVNEGIILSYLQESNNVELSITLSLVQIWYDKLLVKKMICNDSAFEMVNILNTTISSPSSRIDTPMSLKFKKNLRIQNFILNFGELKVSIEDLDIMLPLRCSQFFISDNNNSPFIILTNLTLFSDNGVTLVLEESYISGVLLSFYKLKGLFWDVMFLLRDFPIWMKQENSPNRIEGISLWEFKSSSFIIDIMGECTTLQLKEFTLYGKLGTNQFFTMNCINMSYDSLLNIGCMNVIMSWGNHSECYLLGESLKDSKASIVICTSFEQGNIVLDTNILTLLEFLNDLVWLLFFPAEESTPTFYDENLKTPSIEAIVSCGNVSFAVIGESLCTWRAPFIFNCEDLNSLIIEIKRFSDTRMNVIIKVGNYCSCHVDEYVLMLPSNSNIETFKAVMEWKPPSILEKENRYITLKTTIFTSERFFTFYLPALQEFLRQFNEFGSPLYRLKSIGSRLHFGLRTPCSSVYSVPFWSQKNIIYIKIKNIIALYYPWGKISLDFSTERSNHTHVRSSIPYCRVTWMYDGFTKCMSTDICLVAKLPKIMIQETYNFVPDIFLNGNIILFDVKYGVDYHTQSPKENITVTIKNTQLPLSEILNLQEITEPHLHIGSNNQILISFKEAFNLFLIAIAFFSDNSTKSNSSVPIVSHRERLMKVRIAPFVVFSYSFAVAFVSWENINAIFRDERYVINATGFSFLCDELLKMNEDIGVPKLWNLLDSIRFVGAILEIFGNRQMEGDSITLTKNFAIGSSLLSIGSIFLHISEERLPLLSEEFATLYAFLSSCVPSLPSRVLSSSLPEEDGSLSSNNNQNFMKVVISEAHFGFTWKSRINELQGRLHSSFIGLTLTSNGATILNNGSLVLKWFTNPSKSDRIEKGPSVLFFDKTIETVPIIETFSITTHIPAHNEIRVVVRPIHSILSGSTYLHLFELFGYHLKCKREDPVRLALEKGKISTETDVSTEIIPPIIETSISEVKGNKSLHSNTRKSSIPGGDTSFTQRFSIEFTKLTITVNGDQDGSISESEIRPVVWLNINQMVFQLFSNMISFILREAKVGCNRESDIISICGLKFDYSPVTTSKNELPEVGCAIESVIMKLDALSILSCFDVLIKSPAEEIGPFYWVTIPPNTDIRFQQYTGKKSKMTVITINTSLWELTHDILLTRDGGFVLVFSSANSNNIHVEMNGHSIIIEPSRRRTGADIVMIVDGGLSLTFSGGRFVLPWFASGEKQLRRVERMGEEVLLLPFMAVGEGSYIISRNIRYTTSERCILQEQKYVPKINKDIRRWKLSLEIAYVSVYASSKGEYGTLQATLAIEANIILRNGLIENGEASISDFTLIGRTTDSTSTNTNLQQQLQLLTTITAAIVENNIINPITISISCSESRDFAFSLNKIVIYVMINDLLLLNSILQEVTNIMPHITLFRYSPAEREFELQIQRIIGWKSFAESGGNYQDEIDLRYTEETQGDDERHVKPKFSLAAFSPLMDVTIGSLKYPLLQVTLSDLVLKETMFGKSRTTLLQHQQLFVRVYGKGRWDTVIPANAIITLEAVHSWLKQTRTTQFRLQCDDLVVYTSHLLISKLIHINRQWMGLRLAMRQDLDQDKLASCVSSSCSAFSPGNATHRFINTFSDVFYLFIAKDMDQGEIVPLPSCTAVDLTIPYNKSDEIRLYLYPRYCITLDKHGRHVRNDEGLHRDMRHSSVVVSELQYGHAVGLVIDDLLVVMSCVETQDNYMNNPTFLPEPSIHLQGTTSASVSISNNSRSVPLFAHSVRSSCVTADEAGLVVVRVHSRTALYNASGMIVEVRQYIFGEFEETPLSEDFWIFLPNTEYPLSGTCSRVEIRITLNDIFYIASFSTMSLESGVFLNFQPTGDVALRTARYNNLPVSLFIVLRRYAESGSTVVVLFPRMTVINHIGIPVKLSLWQEEPFSSESYDSEENDDMDEINRNNDNRDGTNNNNNNSTNNRGGGGGGRKKRKSSESSLWKFLGGQRSRGRLIKIAAHDSLPHQGSLPISQCSYDASLHLSLSFSQTGGETLGTGADGPVRVCARLRRRVGREASVVDLRDSAGRRFPVRVSVLHRTLLLSVGLWVVNLTEFPVLLADTGSPRRPAAGQMSNTGIPPSTGVPFPVGCRSVEVPGVSLTLGLDGGWSAEIPTHPGAHGIVESSRREAGITRSCNYVIQFPRVQEGRPVVLLLTPRWVFVNNTSRRLKIYFACSNDKDKEKKKKQGKGALLSSSWGNVSEDRDKNTATTNTTTTTTTTTTTKRRRRSEDITKLETLDASYIPPVTLRPGEHHFSCIGTAVGNFVAFEDTLEDTVPSITSFSSENVRDTNLSDFYEAHRTTPMSVDEPGHATFNLWATLKQPTRIPSVAYGALVTGSSGTTIETPLSSRSSSSSLTSEISYTGEDIAFITGRLSVIVQPGNNLLAVVIDTLHATNILIQNRARGITIAVRQKGTSRRSIIPPCQGRFFLWENYRTAAPVILIHIIGYKGAWFEVDFSRGTSQVRRSATSEDTKNILAPFHVVAFTSVHDAERMTILLTDEIIPMYASFDEAWNTSMGYTFSAPSLELVLWLTEEGMGNVRPRVSLMLRDLHLQTLKAGNTSTLSMMLHRLQVADVRDRDTGPSTVVVLHRASPGSASSGEEVTGGILRCFWRGEEVPQQDFQVVYAAVRCAGGVKRVTELSCILSPFALDVSDHFVVSLWYELQDLLLLLPLISGGNNTNNSGSSGGGNSSTSAGSLLILTSLSRHAFSREVLNNIRRPDSGNSIATATVATGTTTLTPSSLTAPGTSNAAVPSPFSHAIRGDRAPVILFIDQARFSRVTLFITFTRHKPDPLWDLLGMYTLMIPKRFRNMEFTWPVLLVESDATTWGLLQGRVRQWILDGAMRQWTKLTRIGKVMDKFTGGTHERLELAGTPKPMLP